MGETNIFIVCGNTRNIACIVDIPVAPLKHLGIGVILTFVS